VEFTVQASQHPGKFLSGTMPPLLNVLKTDPSTFSWKASGNLYDIPKQALNLQSNTSWKI